MLTGRRFRWVVCQFDILQDLKPESQVISKILCNLPETLDETYERVFVTIPEHARTLVHNALKLVYSHREVWPNDIPAATVLQASQETSPELGLWNKKVSD